MKQIFYRFLKSEDGAITAEWVVLTALAIAFTLGIMASMQTISNTATGSVAANAASVSP